VAFPLHRMAAMDLAIAIPTRGRINSGIFVLAAASALLLGTGAYLFQASRISPRFLFLAIPMGLLAFGTFLLRERECSKELIEALVAGAFVVLGLLPLIGLPQEVWFGAAALPIAAGGAQKLSNSVGRVEALATSQKMMLHGTVLFAASVSAGLLISAV